MLEATLLNLQQKKIPANGYLHNKPDNISVTNRKLSQETQFKDHLDLQNNSRLPLTYSSSMTINGDEGAKFQLLQQLVTNLLKEQSISTEIVFENKEINISELSQEEAQKLVSDEGYFGVEQTSERIFQLAKAIAGGDPTKIDAVREGVEKGFKDALDAFNGQLPDISYRTYDAVMEKLDNWATEKMTL